jgi:hypothetical protein
MSRFPLIKNFKANTVFNTFILAGISQGILLSLTLSTNNIIKKYQNNEFWRWTLSILYIFIITIVSSCVMYFVFGYGA